MIARRGTALTLAAWLAAAGCTAERDEPAPEPVMLSLAELKVAVERNLQRGALVSFWATW